MMASPSAQKTKTAFWTTFALCSIITFLVIELVALKLQFRPNSSMVLVGAMAASYVFAGLRFMKRSVQVLKKRTSIEAGGHCELNMESKAWRDITRAQASGMALLVILGVIFQFQRGEWIALGVLMCGNIAAFFAWRRFGTSFIARVDENGVTSTTIGNKRKFVPWAQIESCQQTQSYSVATDSMGLAWDFRDAAGKTLVKVAPFNVPIEKQQEFSQVLARYLSPSVVT